MKYNSVRGGVKGLSFEEALFSGLASDGGMLMPENIPKVTKVMMETWSKLSYKDLVKEVASLFATEDDIPRTDLNACIDKAFSTFSIPEVVRLARLKNRLNVFELFHGKTMAFKDLSLSCVGQLMEYFLNKRQKHMNILVATSGDTGSASIEAVRGLQWVDIIVWLPKGHISKVQELQMITAIADNVHVYRVDGTSDELDAPIQKLFMDESFAKEHNLCSTNSINWGRIMVQIAHFFYAHFQMFSEAGDQVEIVVPTGGCGNIISGCIAKAMGLPVRLVCAVNANDTMYRTLNSGDFSMADFVSSVAPAMDITNPYNIQRLLYMASNGDGIQVRKWMEDFEGGQKVQIPKEILVKLQDFIGASFTTDDEGIKQTMKQVWDENQYLVCPHTAVGVAYHLQQHDSGNEPKCKRICIATASPAKFTEAVTAAGLTPQIPDRIRNLDTMPTKYSDIGREEDWLKRLKEIIEAITKKRVS